ncbi:MAG TPA: extracellular solute-binding protein [Anaerolineae bacterium]|nr:extracellular solute-binding protein [Anaerolineae bacterium]HOQ99939.1 extracellular solute-binding protein [Anaerolineae bacterium]HPL26832.1 extracellular solute-binding protein [Anaerolineae bacterium]
MRAKSSVFFRVWPVVLVLALIATACAPAAAPTAAPAPTQASAGSPTQPPAPTPVPPTAVPAKPVDIELWAIPTSSQAPAPPDDWVGFKVIREKLNINLKYVPIPQGADGETKVNAAAAANALPDLFQAYSTTLERNKLLDLHKQGLIAPVDDLIKLMPTRVKTHYSDPTATSLVIFDGKQMGFVEVPNLPRREGLVIRKDWVDKLGLKMPTTIDELFTVAKAFTEQDPDGNGQNDTYGLGGFFDGSWGAGARFAFFFGAYGLPDIWNWDLNNFGLSVRSSDYYKALAEFRRWNEAKVIDPDWATINRDEFRIRWPQGRYGIMWEDFAALSMAANYPKFDKNFPEGEWVPLPAPKGPDGKAFYGAYGSIGNIFAVSKKAADAGKGPAIAALLEWMATPEGYYLCGFGQEGINYTLDSDGVVTTAGLPDATKAWTHESMARYTQMRNQLVFVNDPKEVAARYPAHKSINGRTIVPMSFYNFFSTQPWVNSRPQQLILKASNHADLQRFYNENIQGFALGTRPLNEQTWAEFLGTLDSSLNAKKWEEDTRVILKDAGIVK